MARETKEFVCAVIGCTIGILLVTLVLFGICGAWGV